MGMPSAATICGMTQWMTVSGTRTRMDIGV